MTKISKSLPLLLTALGFLVVLSAVAVPRYLLVKASLKSNYTNTDVEAAVFGSSTTDNLVYDIVIPDAMNNTGIEDTLLTDGVGSGSSGESLVAFNSGEPGLEIFLDHGTDDNIYTDGEDILVQVHNGSDAYIGGSSVYAFDSGELYYHDDNAGTAGDYDDGEVIIYDADADTFISAGDVVKTAGKAKVKALTTGDNVCFDGSINNNDNEYDYGEVIWYDVAGNCNAFTPSTDVILAGVVGPSNKQEEFGTEREVAYLDENNDGVYTCSRAGICEVIFYAGDGNDVSDGDDLSLSTIFYDSSSESTDGIAVTGDGWDEAGGVTNLLDFNSAITTFAFVGFGVYTDGNDIFALVHNGSSAVLTDNDESRLFSGTTKYRDNDNSTTYTDGEDIYDDSGSNSGIIDIKQDTLVGLVLKNEGTAVDTTDVASVKYWAEEGTTPGFQAGEDTLLGTATVDGVNNRRWRLGGLSAAIPQGGLRLYATVDIVAFPTNGATFNFKLPKYNDAGANDDAIDDRDRGVFVASANDGPTDEPIQNAGIQTIDAFAPIVTADNLTADESGCAAAICMVGDMITFTWDNSASGDNNTDENTVTANLTNFGGTSTESLFDDGTNGDSVAGDDIYTLDFVVLADDDDGDKTFDATVTDNAGNSTGPVTSTDTAPVDDQAPTVRAGNLAVDDSACGGTGGVCVMGDSIVFIWDNSALGDNNADVTAATADLSDFGGSSSQILYDDGTNGDSMAADQIYVYSLTVAAGDDDGVYGFDLIATDDAGNSNTAVSSADKTSIDNQSPNVNGVNITVTGATGTGGGFKSGDTPQMEWDYTSDGETDTLVSVSFDGSEFLAGDTNRAGSVFGGSYVASLSGGIASMDTNGITIDVTVVDDAGNSTGPITSTVSYTVDNILPIVSDANISISGGTGSGGAYIVGNTLIISWNNNAGGDNNTDSISATADLSQFGGGASVVMTDTAVCSGTASDNVYEACYTIDGTEGIDGTAFNVSVTVTDDIGNTATATDSSNAAVDTVSPVVTDANISIFGGTGTNGAYIVGDTVVAVWNNSATGDNNSDLVNITADLSQFGGGSTVVMTDTIACSGTAGDSVYEACYTIAGTEDIDQNNRNVAVTATDDADNQTTTSDTTDAVVDSIVPELTNTNIYVSGASGTGGTFINGDTPVYTWDVTTEGETDTIATVVFNAANFKSTDTALSGSLSSGKWTVTGTMDAQDDTGNTITATVTDDAGNTGGPVTGSTSYDVDTNKPVVTEANILISGSTGLNSTYKIGDTVTATWNNSAAGDNNTDLSSIAADLSEFGGGSSVTMTDTTACSGTAGDNVYEACYTINGTEAIDQTNRNVSVSVTDDGGNITTTADTSNATVDTIAPSVTGSNVFVNGASGYSGAFIYGDSPELTWAITNDRETDTLSSVLFDGSDFKAGDVALVGTVDSGGDGPVASGVDAAVRRVSSNYVAGLSGDMDLQDDTGNTIAVTVTDNAGNSTGPIISTATYVIDTIVPTSTAYGYYDSLMDGSVDRVDITFSEDVSTNFSADKDEWTFPTSGTVALTAPSSDGSVTVSTSTVSIVPGSSATDTTGGVIAPTISYGNMSGTLTDDAGNPVASFGPVAIDDYAAPLLISATPPADAVDVDPNLDLTANFTEPMKTAGFSVVYVDAVGTQTNVWTNGDANLTTLHTSGYSYNQNYTITLSGTDASVNANSLSNGLAPISWGFDTFDHPSNGRRGYIELVNEEEGQQTTTEQEQTGNGGGGTNNSPGGNNQSQEQTVVNEPESEVLSERFNALYGETVKIVGNPAVYYVDDQGYRHVFMNQDIYQSWYGNDFSQVMEISLEVLKGFPLGVPVPYRPGSLFKINSDPTVYVVTFNRVIRKLGNEGLAEALYGVNWNKMIYDLPDSLFVNYSVGDPVLTADQIVLSAFNDSQITISSQVE